MIRYLVTLSCLAGLSLATFREDHERLFKNLVKQGPAKYGRPVLDEKTQMVVDVEFYLKGLQELDEKHGVMTTSGWIGFSWMNEYFSWDPEEYGGITEIRIPPTDVWIPDVYLFNDATGTFNAKLHENNMPVVVMQDGTCHWHTPSKLRSLCDVPEQGQNTFNCSMTFGSWTYHEGHITLKAMQVSADLSTFHANTEWEIVRAPATMNSKFYECCAEPYADITYTLEVAKRVHEAPDQGN